MRISPHWWEYQLIDGDITPFVGISPQLMGYQVICEDITPLVGISTYWWGYHSIGGNITPNWWGYHPQLMGISTDWWGYHPNGWGYHPQWMGISSDSKPWCDCCRRWWGRDLGCFESWWSLRQTFLSCFAEGIACDFESYLPNWRNVMAVCCCCKVPYWHRISCLW